MSPRPLLAAALLPAAAAVAQGLQGGDYAVTDFTTNSVYRVTPGGSVSTLHAGPPLTSPSGIAITGSFDVLVADYNTGTVFRLPRSGGIAPLATGIQGPIRLAVDRDGTVLVTSLGQRALLRIGPGGQVTPIASGAPFVRPFGIAVDYDGSYLVTDDGVGGPAPAAALYKVTRAGQVTPHWQGVPFRLPQGVALLPDGDYAVMDGIVDAVFRVPRAGGPPAIMVATPAIDNPCSICEDFEGRFVLSESSSAGNRIDLVDRGGNVTTIASGLPFRNLEVVARAPRLSGPPTGGPGLTSTFALEFGGESLNLYVMWATLSVFPGVALSPPDPRAIPGNPDVLFVNSIAANNALFVGWSGILSASGTAAPQLAMPNIQLGPLPIYIQALTIDLRNPGPIRSFSNVHVLRL
jgi:sugar lactone lactonase YvrE